MAQKTISYCSIGDHINESPRRMMKTKLFQFDCKICLLDFIGAPEYFITDFGQIWHRKSVYTNTFGILTRGSVPQIRKDPNLPYGWVMLKTTLPVIWFPVNQLLGWAFDQNNGIGNKFYVTKNITNPLNIKDFKWVKEIDLPDDSLYKEFIDKIYS